MEEEQKKVPEVEKTDNATPAGYRFGLDTSSNPADLNLQNSSRADAVASDTEQLNPANLDRLPLGDHQNLPAKAEASTAVSVAGDISNTEVAPSSGPGGVANNETANIELGPSLGSKGVAVDSLPASIRPDSLTNQAVVPDGSVSTASQATAEGEEDKFSVDEVIGYGWRAMIKYLWPLCGILTSNFLVMSVPTAAIMVLNYTANSGVPQMLSMVLSLCSIVLNQAIALGTVTVWLKIVDGDTISTRDVYSKFNRVWKFMAATFLYWSMVIIGYLCFILPGVYLQLRFQFFPYFISDSDAGPIQALRASHAITKGSLPELFFLSIVTWFIGWVGMLILLIGIFPAQAIQNIALARTYRLLLKNTPESDLPINMPPVPVIAETV